MSPPSSFEIPASACFSCFAVWFVVFGEGRGGRAEFPPFFFLFPFSRGRQKDHEKCSNRRGQESLFFPPLLFFICEMFLYLTKRALFFRAHFSKDYPSSKERENANKEKRE
eukprot:Hpha_TRINITY_DN15667_c0_g1::TRINITY_DN15667_c0_g1_i3::g.102069::m.102069